MRPKTRQIGEDKETRGFRDDNDPPFPLPPYFSPGQVPLPPFPRGAGLPPHGRGRGPPSPPPAAGRLPFFPGAAAPSPIPSPKIGGPLPCPATSPFPPIPILPQPPPPNFRGKERKFEWKLFFFISKDPQFFIPLLGLEPVKKTIYYNGLFYIILVWNFWIGKGVLLIYIKEGVGELIPRKS